MMMRRLHKGVSRHMTGLCLRQLSKPTCSISQRRYSLSATGSVEQIEVKEAEQKKEEPERKMEELVASEGEAVPWYMRSNEDTTQLNPALTEPIPDTPENSPECLKVFVEHMVRELGFTDVTFIDLRHRSPVTIWGSDAILVLATGNTDRHIGRGTNSLMTYIKKTFSVVPSQEGIQTSGFLKVHQRRLKKKAKKMANSDETFDYALEATRFANNWVVLDTKMNGITIHLLTPEKRAELDLEYIWAEDRKALREARKLAEEEHEHENEFEDEHENEESDLGYSSNASSYSPFASGQIRQYHISRPFSALSMHNFAMPNTIPPPTSTSTSSSDFVNSAQPTLEQLQVSSFAGDYKQAVSIARNSYSNNNNSEHTQLILKAHINHLSKIRNTQEASTLTRKSDVIKSFISSFPYHTTQADWRLQLIFMQHAHTLNHNEFPLEGLEEILILQQASGFLVDMWDVEFIVNTIVNSQQFSEKRMLKASDLKSKIIFSILKNCLRPQGINLSTNNTLYLMLYRLWIGTPELNPSAASRDPTPKRDETTGELVVARRNVLNSTAITLYQYMMESGANITKPFLIISLTAFANDNIWGKFWSLWARVSNDKSVDSEIFNTMASLVVKSGNQAAISTLVEQIVPKELMANSDLQTPELAEILTIALTCLDPSGTGYAYVRKLITPFA